MDDTALLEHVIDYYHRTLKQSTEALEYLQRRGLHDDALIEQFNLGYSNRSLGYRLPVKNRKQGALVRKQLQRIGLYRKNAAWEVRATVGQSCRRMIFFIYSHLRQNSY